MPVTSAMEQSDQLGFHQSWFPVSLTRELSRDRVIGVDFLGTRVIMYRDPKGKAVVQSAWCPHLGADLSLGQLVEDRLRCAYHHWRFDAEGACVAIPTGDKIPPGARIFTYPTAEAWGLVWAFNGQVPLFDPPTIPDTEEHELVFEAHWRGIRRGVHWAQLSNSVDFQHLRTLHNLPAAVAPETIDVSDYGIEFRVDTPSFLQHGRVTGANAFGQHLRRVGEDNYMLFTGGPIDHDHTNSYYVVGVSRQPDEAADATARRLAGLREFVERLLGEDEPVLNTMRFRPGVLVGADRHLARFFKYMAEFPRAEMVGDPA